LSEASPAAPTLRTALKSYPQTDALLSKKVSSPLVHFDFQDIEPIHGAFKPMAEKQAFDVSEMAIFTYLQAKTYEKPIVLLPVVLASRLQHGCIVYNTDFHDRLTPDMLPGKTVGVRAYSQTTGAWVRNILEQEHGIDLRTVRWLTFEGAHLDAYKEPSFVTRAPKGKNLIGMLMAGEIDAGILGNDLPNDPKIKPVIPDAEEAGRAWFDEHGLIPINHMLVVTQDLVRSRPDVVREIYDLFKRSKALASTKAGSGDMRPIGFEAVGPSLDMTLDLAFSQQLVPRRFSQVELFADARRILGSGA
jgi:4,5-dihydroxyphthalate decarboxylase